MNICNLAEHCNKCPFESECDLGFENIVDREELIQMLNDKMGKIIAMLNNIDSLDNE